MRSARVWAAIVAAAIFTSTIGRADAVPGTAASIPAFSRNGEPVVALEPLAAALGWKVVRLPRGARFLGEDHVFAISAGSTAIREDDDVRATFGAPPIELGGHLYLSANDAARLFGVRAVRTDATVEFRPLTQLNGAVRIAEIPRPAAPPRSLVLVDGLEVAVDGTSIGAHAVDRGRDAQPLVAVRPLAAALGWKFVPLQNGARLLGEDHVLAISVGSKAIRENGDVRGVFREPLADRGGHLYLAANDAARLFGIRVTLAKRTVDFLRPVELGSDMQVAEVPRPATPRPRPTPRNLRRVEADSSSVANAGRVLLSLDRTGSTKLLHLTSDTRGGFVQTHIESSGLGQLGAPTGTVTVGSEEKHVSIGIINDPLSGLILRGSVLQGIALHQTRLRRDQFAGRRYTDGRTVAGEVFELPGSGGADALAILSQNGAYDQTILRRFRAWRKPWGEFSRELLIGSRGVGIGFGARTKGRTFLESTVTYATRGLPLGPNDAPVSLSLGRDLSPATTVVGGFFTTPQQPLGPFLALSTRSRDILASVSVSNRSISTSLAYQTPNANFQIYSVPGAQWTSGMQGTLYLPGAVIDAQSNNALGSHDGSIQLRTARRGLNFIAGIGFPGGGRAGPITGISVPIGRMVAIEGSLRPSASGPYTLRLSLATTIGARRPPSVPKVAATVQVSAPGVLPVMRLYVDGFPQRKFSTATTRIDVSRGLHTFAVESLDGSYGSTETSVRIESPGDSVALALWPERSVNGRVRLDTGTTVPVDFNLANIIIVIQPGDLTAETSGDGAFIFPKQPMSPESTIRIDPGSLPRELRGAEAIPLGEKSAELRLLPGLPIEHQIFKAK